MDEAVQTFGESLATAIIAKNWKSVHGMLAPWIRTQISEEGVRAFFEDDYRETLEANSVEGMHYPEFHSVSGNISTLEDLRKPTSFSPARPIPADVTESNFRQWMIIRLQCSDDQMAQLDFDQFSEVWAIVVECPEGLRIGYWSHSAY